jgi:hypothetical protein
MLSSVYSKRLTYPVESLKYCTAPLEMRADLDAMAKEEERKAEERGDIVWWLKL